ncbi:spinster family MFS transporter [Sphingobium phenoxybenzoativorans]|uniref:spinster family MFS transporter n=1 Tax=Sphingobium phenoxybenzoativorans TaxID=1592790 RepID=UPI000872E251|nr:MFS transporter [Sphingobium phenoxybenzoativorans]
MSDPEAVRGDTSPLATKGAATRSRGHTLAMLVAIYTMSFVDRNILYVVAPSVQTELGLNDMELGLLSGLAFAFFYAVMALPIARLAERRSRVALMAGALLLWSVMTALCGAASKFWHLFAARLGVGVGEGACTPCAQSIICDLYPPEKRATALSTYAIGVPLGVMIGGMGGAIVADMLGWRGAFVMAAIPGLILAAVFWLTVPEPRRGANEAARYVDAAAPSLRAVAARLWQSASFRHTALGCAVASVPGNALQMFFIVYLVRVHGLDLLTAGISFGLFAGVTGAIGMFWGGRITDLFAKRDVRAYGLVPAITFICLPPLLAAALTRDSLLALSLFILVPATTYVFNIGASYAVTNNLVEPRMRATTNAILLLIITIFGAGIGPALVGWVSDRFAAGYFGPGYALQCIASSNASPLSQSCAAASAYGIKLALIATSAFYFWSAAHYFRLSSKIRRELPQP